MKLVRLFSTLEQEIRCPQIKLSEMDWSSPSEIPKEIPVISLEHDSEPEQLRKMSQVAELSSCFYLKDYGISEYLHEAIINNAANVFSSENPSKYTHPCVDIGPRGVQIIGSSGSEEFFEPVLESLGTCMEEALPEPKKDKYYEYFWLGRENIYPNLKFKEIYEEYYDQGYKIGEHLTNLVEKSIETNDPITIADEIFGEIPLVVHFYPKAENTNRVRLPPHVDPNSITMLYQTPNENGKYPLEIMYKGKFIGVPAVRGHQIVCFGEVANSISQSYFKAAIHRVTNLEDSTRWSIPFFFGPTNETVMRIPPETNFEHGYTSEGVTTFKEFVSIFSSDYNMADAKQK